jgi:hypothetical protein
VAAAVAARIGGHACAGLCHCTEADICCTADATTGPCRPTSIRRHPQASERTKLMHQHRTPLVPETIGLATRIQRRRDFTAHLSGYFTGAALLGVVAAVAPRTRAGVAITMLTWATALSFQHFRYVLRGPVTGEDVAAEGSRLRRAA